MEWLKTYQRILDQAQMKVDAKVWIIISLAVSFALAIMTWFVILVTKIPVSTLMAFVILLVLLDLFLGYPIIKKDKRIDSIEEALPDALKQMADTLKAGGTYEYALREISTAQYGPLTQEMAQVLRKLEEGENLENSLRSFSRNIDSRLVKRSTEIILDSIKAGAGLADILDEIADDIRAMHRIGVERKTRTLMQVLFMVAAGGVVAPMIMGMVSSIVGFLMTSTLQGLGAGMDVEKNAKIALETIKFLMQFYIIIEVVASGLMIALMRHGKAKKGLMYIPILLLVAFIVYYLAAFMAAGMVGVNL